MRFCHQGNLLCCGYIVFDFHVKQYKSTVMTENILTVDGGFTAQ